MTDAAQAPAVSVSASPWAGVTSQVIRTGIIAGSAFAFEHFLRTETAVIAGVAFATAVVTAGFGVWERIHRDWKMRFMAARLPDHLATLKGAVRPNDTAVTGAEVVNPS